MMKNEWSETLSRTAKRERDERDCFSWYRATYRGVPRYVAQWCCALQRPDESLDFLVSVGKLGVHVDAGGPDRSVPEIFAYASKWYAIL